MSPLISFASLEPWMHDCRTHDDFHPSLKPPKHPFVVVWEYLEHAIQHQNAVLVLLQFLGFFPIGVSQGMPDMSIRLQPIIKPACIEDAISELLPHGFVKLLCFRCLERNSLSCVLHASNQERFIRIEEAHVRQPLRRPDAQMESRSREEILPKRLHWNILAFFLTNLSEPISFSGKLSDESASQSTVITQLGNFARDKGDAVLTEGKNIRVGRRPMRITDERRSHGLN